ncbi:hypothetical protein AJ87_04480 [Rhizobium yanglingense]|nr:hypothetical protein AJ87_04480 [Rhizobium yanglingense]
MAGFFSDKTHVGHAKKRQEDHWANLAGGNFDESYVNGVTAVGRAHARIGLEPRWYIGGYAIVIAELVKGIMEKQWPSRFGHQKGKALAEKLASVIKASMLDMTIQFLSISMRWKRSGASMKRSVPRRKRIRRLRSSICVADWKLFQRAISKQRCRRTCRAISATWRRTITAPRRLFAPRSHRCAAVPAKF